MATKTGMGIVPKVVAVAMVLVAAGIFYPKLTRDKDEDRGILLSVFFKPEHRSGITNAGRQFPDKVVVELTVGGVVYPNEPVIDSPWTKVLPPGRGRKIVLRATQIYGQTLGCSIKQPGYDPATDSKIGPSLVSCIYTTK